MARERFDVLMEEALIFQHLSYYLQIIFVRDFRRCSVFSLFSAWHGVVTNQSFNKRLKNLAVPCLGNSCRLSFVTNMKVSFLDLDFFFSVIIHCLAEFTQSAGVIIGLGAWGFLLEIHQIADLY